MTELRASVRQVVEFSLHERDLSPAAFAAKRMREGAAAHKARQSAGAREETAYQAEKSLSADYAAREITLRVTGRADGLLLTADGARIVEEIKLGTAENPLVPAHRAQAAMYGHMLCQKEGLTGVRLRILYVDENGAPVRLYEEEADSARLKGEFEALCAAYCAWAERLLARRRARDASLFGLAFPYGAYRAGQRTFAANVYVAIRERKRLFAQAPTGIGKTMAALYPAALALGEGKCARVLMLTARTTGRKSAMDALAILRAHGARLLAVEIAAKDKVCPMEKRDCRPEVCPYAKGFYDRLPDALAEALTGGDWGRGQLDALAQKHTLCPFELALSLAQEADVVVCDVPCSGLGIIRKKPDIRYKDMASLAGLPAIQSAILDNASRYVRRGGTLVYSTCTVLPEENERVTDAFLRAHLDFTYDTFALPGPIGTVEGHITLWPQRHGTDGFYICRMTRKE